jgi:hypothetical protein
MIAHPESTDKPQALQNLADPLLGRCTRKRPKAELTSLSPRLS